LYASNNTTNSYPLVDKKPIDNALQALAKAKFIVGVSAPVYKPSIRHS